MATDAQGRQLSDDGYYYWDGAAWQPVAAEAASAEAASAPAAAAGTADPLQAAIMKPEDERTDADWELLANALESDKAHVQQAAQAAGAQLTE